MGTERPNTVLFYSYGAGPHVDETRFSMLTLRRFPASAFRDVTIRVLTDRPDLFESDGFEIDPVSSELYESWMGPYRFNHRCKILALRHAFEQFGGKCILVDGDTYFTRPPARLFDRIGPDRTFMHKMEGRLGHSRHEHNHRLAEILMDRSPGYNPLLELAQGPATWQRNAGAVGLHESHLGLLDDVLALTDYLRARISANSLEQLAFNIILSAKTHVTSSHDVIFHYCTSFERQAFRARLPGLLAESAGMGPVARARWLYARRLRPSPAIWTRNRLKDVLNATGIYPARDRFECC